MSTLVKKVTTEVTGKYLVGKVLDADENSTFVLNQFKLPRKNESSPSILTSEQVDEIISEFKEVKAVLEEAKLQPVTPMTAKLLKSDDSRFTTYTGASEAISNSLAMNYKNDAIETVELIGEGKAVTQFNYFWGSDEQTEPSVYVALEFIPPSNVKDLSNAIIKTFEKDGSEKTSAFADKVLIQRITAINKVLGRTIEISWDGVNFTPVKLDFTNVTGL